MNNEKSWEGARDIEGWFGAPATKEGFGGIDGWGSLI